MLESMSSEKGDDGSSKRQRQNRAAQKSYRERHRRYVRELENHRQELLVCRRQLQDLQSYIRILEFRLQSLQQENQWLKRQNRGNLSGAITPMQNFLRNPDHDPMLFEPISTMPTTITNTTTGILPLGGGEAGELYPEERRITPSLPVRSHSCLPCPRSHWYMPPIYLAKREDVP